MFVITGATGNTGKVIAEKLLSAGKQITVVGREAAKLQDFVQKGAKAAIGSLEDTKFLAGTFKGAEAVYALIPPKFDADNFRGYQNKVADAFVSAIKESGVKNVVTLSSIGAHMPEGAGVVQGLHDFEQKLKSLEGVNVLNLRAGFFLQNFLGMIPVIKNFGVLGGFPIDGNIKIPMVHTNDVADAAVKHLLNPAFRGQSHIYVTGERDLTLTESAPVLGKAIGNDGLKYTQFPYDQAKAGMQQMGASESLADTYVEFCKAINEGKITSDFVRTAENTTPTSIEDFAKEFAFAYNQ